MSDDWKQIDKTCGPMVWKVVYKILQSHSESLDCYQTVMIEAFETSKTSTIRNWPGFLKWLAVRRGIDRLRANKKCRDRIDGSQDIGLLSKPRSSISSSMEMEELKSRIKDELTTLPDSQAEAFWLRFIEQMSYSEIAEQMNIQSQTVGVLIHRARAHMRHAIAYLQQSVGNQNEQAIHRTS